MAQHTASPQPTRAEDCPTAWFAVLERARIEGDARREAEAVRQLKRLGVTIDWAEAASDA